MTHTGFTSIVFIAPLILFIITFSLAMLFLYKRAKTGIISLEWLFGIFMLTSLIGLSKVLSFIFHDEWSIFAPTISEFPLGTNIVRLAHMATLIFLFVWGEQFLSDRINNIRLIIISVLTSLYFFLTFDYIITNDILLTNEVIPFAKDTVFGELIFDIIQLFTISLVFYAFWEQYKTSTDPTINKYLITILSAIILFLISNIIEILEHFLPFPKFNNFVLSIPTFLILGYFYIRNPNFIFLAPVEVGFLQVITPSGKLIYAAEINEEETIMDMLVGPSLTSINSLVGELLSKDKPVNIDKFSFKEGYIVFEQNRELRGIIQTSRMSGMLIRSFKYFLDQFYQEFEKEIESIERQGKMDTQALETKADDVFRQSIPIIQSKTIISSFTE